MIAQGPEDIEITSGFGPLRPLMDARWEGSTAQNDPLRTLPRCSDAPRSLPPNPFSSAFSRDEGP